MESIKKFIKRFILFSIFSIAVYLIGLIGYGEIVPDYFQQNIFFEKFAYGFSNTRFKEVKNTSEVDIVFLGSSRSYRHYDPRIFGEYGYNSFNLGSSAQTFLQTEILVNRYIERLNPDYVVLDIYPGMFSSDGVESSFDLISNDYNDLETFKLALQLRNIKVMNTWIFAVYKEYICNSLDDIENKAQKEDTYVNGGFVQRKIRTNQNYSDINHQKWKYNELQWEAFVRTIQKIKQTDAQLIIVHSPRNSHFRYSKPERLLTYLDSLNLSFYNYKNMGFLSDSLHFYDPSHLNQNGVNLYNDFFYKRHFND
ncbi:hypothetical protein G3I01_10985 [Gramella sp. MT6]|uniref:hypothetical protein n=1 Tax=Gramella sp. MT6 TaxID=2705471 RepID=UPI001C5D5AB5|nr:hypothetical protein [Gramella sp. MT6]QYA26017.1 hypothetical protein G3I01_10985 [Gramella sp. MT6]